MKRRATEIAMLKSRHRLDVKYGRDRELGRYRKKKPLDFGRSGCTTCHSDKLCGHEETRQEELASVREVEQVTDLLPEPLDPAECQRYSGCNCFYCECWCGVCTKCIG